MSTGRNALQYEPVILGFTHCGLNNPWSLILKLLNYLLNYYIFNVIFYYVILFNIGISRGPTSLSDPDISAHDLGRSIT